MTTFWTISIVVVSPTTLIHTHKLRTPCVYHTINVDLPVIFDSFQIPKIYYAELYVANFLKNIGWRYQPAICGRSKALNFRITYNISSHNKGNECVCCDGIARRRHIDARSHYISTHILAYHSMFGWIVAAWSASRTLRIRMVSACSNFPCADKNGMKTTPPSHLFAIIWKGIIYSVCVANEWCRLFIIRNEFILRCLTVAAGNRDTRMYALYHKQNIV